MDRLCEDGANGLKCKTGSGRCSTNGRRSDCAKWEEVVGKSRNTKERRGERKQQSWKRQPWELGKEQGRRNEEKSREGSREDRHSQTLRERR